MNALAVQNPRHKCNFGNNLSRNDSVTDREITADNIKFDSNNNYYTEIILQFVYLCVCVCTLQLTLQVLLAI